MGQALRVTAQENREMRMQEAEKQGGLAARQAHRADDRLLPAVPVRRHPGPGDHHDQADDALAARVFCVLSSSRHRSCSERGGVSRNAGCSPGLPVMASFWVHSRPALPCDGATGAKFPRRLTVAASLAAWLSIRRSWGTPGRQIRASLGIDLKPFGIHQLGQDMTPGPQFFHLQPAQNFGRRIVLGRQLGCFNSEHGVSLMDHDASRVPRPGAFPAPRLRLIRGHIVRPYICLGTSGGKPAFQGNLEPIGRPCLVDEEQIKRSAEALVRTHGDRAAMSRRPPRGCRAAIPPRLSFQQKHGHPDPASRVSLEACRWRDMVGGSSALGLRRIGFAFPCAPHLRGGLGWIAEIAANTQPRPPSAIYPANKSIMANHPERLVL